MKRIYNLLALLVLFSVAGFTGLQDAFAAAPTTSARNLTFSNITSTGATITWLNGNGTGRIAVVYDQDASVGDVDAAVADGTLLSGNANYSAGTDIVATGVAKVVYQGTGSTRTVTVSGLASGTTYNVKVYEYKIDGGTDPEYRKNSATNNPRSFTTVGLQPPMNLTNGAKTDNSFVFTYDNAVAADYYELQVDNHSNFSSPLDDYDAVDIGKPDPAEYEVGGLDANTTYYYRLRSVDDGMKSDWSVSQSITTNPDVTPPTVIGVERLNNNMIRIYFTEDVAEAGSENAFTITVPGAPGSPFIGVDLVTHTDNYVNISITDGDNPLASITNGENVTISFTSASDLIQDAALNDVANFTATLYDWTPPAVANILRNDNQYTNGNTASYSVDFDEPILKSSLTSADFALTGAAAASSGKAIASINPVTEGGDFSTSFTVNVTGIDVEGDLELEFTGKVFDAITNGSANESVATYNSGEVYTYDYTKPANGIMSITEIALDENNVDGFARETLLDNDATNPEYMNIAKRNASNYTYMKVNINTADATMNGGKFAVKYRIKPELAPVDFGGTYVGVEEEDLMITYTDVNTLNGNFYIKIPGGTNLHDELLNDVDNANGVEYEFAVEYTDRAGNTVLAPSTTNEKVIKDIVAPELAGYVSTAVSTTPGDAGKFFNNSGSIYYNSTTNGVEIKVKSVYPDPTIDGESIYVRPYREPNTTILVDDGDYDVMADETNEFITLIIDPTSFESDLSTDNPGSTVLLFRADVTDVAGNAATRVDIQNSDELDGVFEFRYDISAPALTSITFNPSDNYVIIDEDLYVTLTLTGDETGAALVESTSNINGESVTEFDDFTFETNTPGIIRYTVAEGDNFIANSAEIPFSLKIRDVAGNIMTVQASDDIFEDDQPGIDSKVPTYSAGSITLTPRNEGDAATVYAFATGEIEAGDAVVSTNTTYIEALIDLATATENMNGGKLRVYPSYNAETGYNGYFEYNLTGNDEFDVDLLLSDLTGAQDGEDGGDDFVWNSSANGDVNLFLKFRFVSVGGNVGEMFPTNGLGNFPVDIDRPTASTIDVVTSATGTNYGSFSLLTGQYTNADYVGHKVVFDEIVNIAATGFFNVTAPMGETRDDNVGDGVAGTFGLFGGGFGRYSANGATDDEWIIYGRYNGNGSPNTFLINNFESTSRTYDAAGNEIADAIELTDSDPFTLDNIAPAEVTVTATADAGNTGYYKDGATKITVSFEMPFDQTLNGGSFDVQYSLNGTTNWTTISGVDYDDVDIDGDDINDDPAVIKSIDISNTILGSGEGNLDILDDGETRHFRVVLSDRAGNSTESTSDDITFDLTAPEIVSIERTRVLVEDVLTDPGTTLTSETASFTVTFSEVMDKTTLDAGDFAIANLDGNVTGTINIVENTNESVYTVTVTGITGGGELRIDYTGLASDLAGNQTAADDFSDEEIYTVDITAPTILSIERTSGAPQHTNAATISYTVTFSELMDPTTISTADFAVGTNGTVHSVTLGGTNDVYIVVCSTATVDPNYTSTLSLSTDPAHNVKDVAGNQLTNPTPSGDNQTYIVDKTLPTLSSIQRCDEDGVVGGSELTNAANVYFRVTFSEDVTVSPETFESVGGAAISFSALNNLEYDDVWVVQVTTDEADNNVEYDLTVITEEYNDRAMNNGTDVTASPNEKYTVDRVAPVVTITRNDVILGNNTSKTTTDNTISFTLDFSEEVDLVIGDITVNDADATFTAIDADDLVQDNEDLTKYVLTITGVGGNGTLGITVDNGVADNAGNQMGADEISDLFTIDNTLPTLTSIQRCDDAGEVGGNELTNASNVYFRVTFSEDVAVSNATFTSVAERAISYVPLDPVAEYDNVWIVTVATDEADDNLAYGLSIVTTEYTDLAGNDGTDVTAETDEEYTVDRVAPTSVAVSVEADGGNYVEGYYNISNTGVRIQYMVPDEPGGLCTLQVWNAAANAGAGQWQNVSGYTSMNIIPSVAQDPNENPDNNEAEEPADYVIAENNETIAAVRSANNGNIMKFRLNIVDEAGNETTSTVENESDDITIDETAPTQVDNPVLATTGTGQVEGYYNTTSNGVTLGFIVPNEVDGTYQVQVFDDSDDSWDNIGSAVTIITGTEATANNEAGDLASVAISDEDLSAYVTSAKDGNSLKFRVNVTDVAGNSITGTNESNAVTVDETAPVISGVTFNNPNTLRKVDQTVIAEVTMNANESTGTVGIVTINGVSIDLEDDVTEPSNENPSVFTATYTILEGNTDRAEDALPFSITFTDVAGNTITRTRASEGFENVESPAIDANSPALANNGFYTPSNVVIADPGVGETTAEGYNAVAPKIGLSYGTADMKKVYGVSDAASDDNVYFRVRLNTTDASLEGGSVQLQYQANGADNDWENVEGILDASISNGERTQGYTDLTLDEITLNGLMTSQIEFRAAITDLAGNELITNLAHFGTLASTPVDYLTYSVDPPTLTYTTPEGCVNVYNELVDNSFYILVGVDDRPDYIFDETKYTGNIGGQLFTVVDVIDDEGQITLEARLNSSPGNTGFYDMTLTITDPDGNFTTVTKTGVDQVKFGAADDTEAKIVEVGDDFEDEAKTTETVCADGETDVTFKYVTSIADGTDEEVRVRVTRNSITSDLTVTTNYTVDETTNTIVVFNEALEDGDILSVGLQGDFTCEEIFTGNLTVTRNPLPDAATIAVTGATQPVCYNSATGVVLTIDAAATDRADFNYTYSIEKRNGVTWSSVGTLTHDGVDVTIASNVVTLKDIGDIVNDNTANAVRVTVTKTRIANPNTGCSQTAVSSVITVNSELQAMTTGYGGPTSVNKSTTNHSFTITAPEIGTATSYNWRILLPNAASVNDTVVNGPTTAKFSYSTTTLSNTIDFGSAISLGTGYRVIVRAVGACNTGAWPATNQGHEFEVSYTSSSFSAGKSATNRITINIVNGGSDGRIVLGHKASSSTLAGDVDHADLIANITGTPNLTWASAPNPTIDFGGQDRSVRYLYDSKDNSNTNIVVLLPSGTAARHNFRLIDFAKGDVDDTKNLRTYRVSSSTAVLANATAKDGEFEKIETLNTISAISPNPAKDNIMFNMSVVEDSYVTITIHSLEGSTVLTFKDNEFFGVGEHLINIPLKDFTAGAYAISINFGQEMILETFMVMP